MLSKIVYKIIPNQFKKKFKDWLYKRFGYLNVTRPYIIQIQNEGRFKDQIAIVTGGSGAIGRAICCRLAAEGAIVYICGMTESKINSVAKEIADFGGTAYPCKLNVTEAESITKLFETIVNKHGKIDILVTAAGGSAREKNNFLVHQDLDVIKNVLNTNLEGTILSVREAAKQMIKQNSGKIITISSTIGINGKAGFSEYAAAKAGIIAFVKSLAMELGKFGITVNCVSPGIVQRNRITYQQLMKIKKTNYLNGFCTPEDISNMVSFLASDEASFITGQNFIVDGGRSLGLKGD
jgi:3-oxoacyl-[acyl-carrier protein] reductase